MKCTECSAELGANARFCNNCGAPAAPPSSWEPAATTAGEQPTMVSGSTLAGWLSVKSGAGEGQQLRLRGTMRIGRTADNEIVLDDTEASRHHAAISQEASGYSLQDLNSTNGTFLNEQLITVPRFLKDGDRIKIGDTTLLFGWQPVPTAAVPPPLDEAQPTIVAPHQYPDSTVQGPSAQTLIPPSPATVPQQGKATKRSRGLPVVGIVLGGMLVVLLCVVVAVGLYVVLGRSGSGLPFISAGETQPPIITQVVTDTPSQVVTLVVTNTPEPTLTTLATSTPEPTPSMLPTDTPIPGPLTVRVAPDGSGDYASLEAAVEAVPPGSTILLDPGAFQLTESLEIEKSLSLRGAGMDQTTIAGSEGDQVVLFTGPATFAAEDITFRYEGTGPARVVTIDNGEIDIARCRFSGGIWSDAEKMGGDGLLLWGKTTGDIRESVFEENANAGIEIQDQSQPLIEDNLFRTNEQSGLAYFDDSGGTARRNELTGNGLHGIEVRERAQPTLEGNTCTGNAEDGIAYFEQSSGIARQNTCSENGLHGIGVSEEAQPTLEENTCRDNTEVGIRFSDSAGGLARRNICAENGLHGISVNGEAQPTLEENDVRNNTEVGIRFSGSSGGTARNNTCTGNGLHGFQIKDQADPTLEGNISNDNVECGFGYFENARGIARQNICVGNKWNMYVADTANPELVGGGCSEG